MTGCSVYKASTNDGVSLEEVMKCKSKSCFIANGMEIVDGHDTNNKYIEHYRGLVKKSGATYFRSAGYALADVMTLGAWEVVGTPLEGSISNDRKYLHVEVLYKDRSCSEVESIDFSE